MVPGCGFGEAPVAERHRFKWKTAQHIGVCAMRSVVEAHDENASIMRDLAPVVLIARYGHGGLIEELLEEPPAPLPPGMVTMAEGGLASFDPIACHPGHLTTICA